jgi:hypothetical protein
MSDGKQPEKDFKRAEGVYCEWITYPPGGFEPIPNLLQIERVNGDCSITRVTVTRDEASVIAEAVAGSSERLDSIRNALVDVPLEQRYAAYANHCAIQKRVPMTWHTWKRESVKSAALSSFGELYT